MKVKDKEKLNDPLEGWQILSAISSMVFHTVQCGRNIFIQKSRDEKLVDFPKFWDYLKNCTSSDFPQKKDFFFPL